MVKKTIGITVEIETWEKFVEQVGRGFVSKTIEDFMESYSKNIGKEDLDIVILKKEMEKLRRRISNDSSKLRKFTETSAKVEQEMEEKKLRDLKKEQKDLENLKSCVLCGSVIKDGAKRLTTPSGVICDNCVRTKPSNEIGRLTR